jgi:hypothetical protein
MRRILVLSCFVASVAFAQAADVAQMGPAARKVVDEKKVKKEIEAFFVKCDKVENDFEGALATIDFPYFMATDDLKGVPESQSYSREDYVKMMKPMWEGMPKDMKTKHKRTIVVLSDALANVVDDWQSTTGKTKISGRNASLVVKVSGEWKLKSVTEAGWGGAPGK